MCRMMLLGVMTSVALRLVGHTTWVLYAHNMSITCTQHGDNIYTTSLSHAHHMGISSTPHVYHKHNTYFHMNITWELQASNLGTTCTPQRNHLHTTWVSHAHNMRITCTHGITYRMSITCISHGYHIHNTWV